MLREYDGQDNSLRLPPDRKRRAGDGGHESMKEGDGIVTTPHDWALTCAGALSRIPSLDVDPQPNEAPVPRSVVPASRGPAARRERLSGLDRHAR